ncbi:MAG: hypothetical protein WBB82_18045 [Limnothrix sp.]
MTPQQTSQVTQNFMGLFCISLGCLPIAVSLGLLPADPATIHAPLWVIFACGIVFVLGGLMIIFGERHPRFNHVCALVLLSGMGAIAGWVGLFSDAAGFSGGIPFIPRKWNILFGRTLITSGSILCFAMAVYALQQALKPSEKE